MMQADLLTAYAATAPLLAAAWAEVVPAAYAGCRTKDWPHRETHWGQIELAAEWASDVLDGDAVSLVLSGPSRLDLGALMAAKAFDVLRSKPACRISWLRDHSADLLLLPDQQPPWAELRRIVQRRGSRPLIVTTRWPPDELPPELVALTAAGRYILAFRG